MSLISWEYYDESQDFANLRYVLLDIHNYVIICTKWEKSKYVQYSDLFWCKMHVCKHCKIFQPGCNDHLDFSRKCALLQLIIPFLYPWIWADWLEHPVVPFTGRNINTFCSQCFSTTMEVQVILEAVPGLVLIGKPRIERGSLIILQFVLDCLCHGARI